MRSVIAGDTDAYRISRPTVSVPSAESSIGYDVAVSHGYDITIHFAPIFLFAVCILN
jgi:hypothetical protein